VRFAASENQTQEVNRMKGEITKVWENETKDKKTYHVLDVNGERYSVWDPKLIEGIKEGDHVEYDWKKSGNFKKIVDLKKIDLTPDLEGRYRPDRKSLEIIRMSCVKSASELLNGVYMDLDHKISKAIEISKEFEKYVLGQDSEKG
jgi:hypothetical protein